MSIAVACRSSSRRSRALRPVESHSGFWLYKKNREYEAAGGFLLGRRNIAFKALRPW